MDHFPACHMDMEDIFLPEPGLPVLDAASPLVETQQDGDIENALKSEEEEHLLCCVPRAVMSMFNEGLPPALPDVVDLANLDLQLEELPPPDLPLLLPTRPPTATAAAATANCNDLAAFPPSVLAPQVHAAPSLDRGLDDADEATPMLGPEEGASTDADVPPSLDAALDTDLPHRLGAALDVNIAPDLDAGRAPSLGAALDADLVTSLDANIAPDLDAGRAPHGAGAPLLPWSASPPLLAQLPETDAPWPLTASETWPPTPLPPLLPFSPPPSPPSSPPPQPLVTTACSLSPSLPPPPVTTVSTLPPLPPLPPPLLTSPVWSLHTGLMLILVAPNPPPRPPSVDLPMTPQSMACDESDDSSSWSVASSPLPPPLASPPLPAARPRRARRAPLRLVEAPVKCYSRRARVSPCGSPPPARPSTPWRSPSPRPPTPWRSPSPRPPTPWRSPSPCSSPRRSRSPRRRSSPRPRLRKSAKPPRTGDCHMCGKLNLKRLDKHLNTHLRKDDRPYQCELCLRRFTQTEHKRRHMQSAHKVGSPSRLVPPCRYCNKTLSRRDKLKEHERQHQERGDCLTCKL